MSDLRDRILAIVARTRAEQEARQAPPDAQPDPSAPPLTLGGNASNTSLVPGTCDC